MRKAESQSHFRQCAIRRSQVFLQRVDPLHNLLLPVTAEILTAEIVGLELCLLGDCPSQAPLVERYPGDHAQVFLQSQGKQVALRALVEDVVDHLNRVD